MSIVAYLIQAGTERIDLVLRYSISLNLRPEASRTDLNLLVLGVLRGIIRYRLLIPRVRVFADYALFLAIIVNSSL